jgi:hypothetical protein
MTALLLGQLIPLLLLIGVGYVAGRWLRVQAHSLAMLAIYFLAPVVHFGGVARLNFQSAYLLLPPLLFGIAASLAVLSYWLVARWYSDNTRNLVALSASTGNTGYFGTPLVLALFGPTAVGLYFLMNFAVALCETTVGYYFGARGRHGVRDSLLKVLKLPANYAVLLGLLWNALGWSLPQVFLTWWDRLTGAWIVVGMMLIGVALSQAGGWRANARLTGLLFSIKFVLWPACTFGFALLDRAVLGLFDPMVHALLLIIGVVPLAGNTVAFATQLHLRPGEMAAAVLESTVFAVFYIPLVFWLTGVAG